MGTNYYRISFYVSLLWSRLPLNASRKWPSKMLRRNEILLLMKEHDDDDVHRTVWCILPLYAWCVMCLCMARRSLITKMADRTCTPPYTLTAYDLHKCNALQWPCRDAIMTFNKQDERPSLNFLISFSSTGNRHQLNWAHKWMQLFAKIQ